MNLETNHSIQKFPESIPSPREEEARSAQICAEATLVMLRAGKYEGLVPPTMNKQEVRDLIIAGARRDFLRTFFGSRGLQLTSPIGNLVSEAPKGISRSEFIQGLVGLAFFRGKAKEKLTSTQPDKLPSLELMPFSTLEQTSVRCFGGIHVVTVPSFSIILVRFYAQAAMEMAARSTGRLDSTALSWAFREIREKVVRANKDYFGQSFNPDRLQIGDRVLLLPDELYKVIYLSVPTNLTPIEVVARECTFKDCGGSAVGWFYKNQPRVMRIHGFEGPGGALKKMEIGMSGTIRVNSPDGRTVLSFKVIRKETQSGNEYNFNAPGVFLVAEDFSKARTISCAVQDGSQVCLLELELSLPK